MEREGSRRDLKRPAIASHTSARGLNRCKALSAVKLLVSVRRGESPHHHPSRKFPLPLAGTVGPDRELYASFVNASDPATCCDIRSSHTKAERGRWSTHQRQKQGFGLGVGRVGAVYVWGMGKVVVVERSKVGVGGVGP